MLKLLSAILKQTLVVNSSSIKSYKDRVQSLQNELIKVSLLYMGRF